MNTAPQSDPPSDFPAIAGFRPSRLLGTGSTARVYLARDGEGRRVALKVLLPAEELQGNPGAAEMFANEVRMTLQLRHPHLARGYSGQAYGEEAWLALEYFREGSLDTQLLPGIPLPLEQGVRILRGVAAGLDYMHGQGAVHQDVKSQNVYLDGERAVLADFGCSYMMGQGGRAGGSPFYMAPEIYRGEGGTAASDVYSFGVLGYEVLAGQRPFQGESYEDLMGEHLLTAAPSLSHLSPQVPRPLARLLQRALAKAPADRPTLAELLAALDEVAGVPEPLSAAPAAACTESGARLGRHAAASPLTSQVPASQASASQAPAPAPADEPAAGGLLSRWNPFRKKSDPA
ncbi:serine/threonine protein kinase [Deinococcus proteolyticus MRP]|uniref:Serine/threonine protein kinase n=1 Tax=Deinococcus proteolyticus (strain ATCC 35074 / DSM 20540 / JCM 6276 / NBRC 101906 / NCIMB 13154 / VKM Ac-1939 / CCM 2703 / MRP) TaxID=693977 RepID=F0RL41_DEIPM|nr:serine/threonine-protein kinase [Deinococcus proteolyticus]ADY26833.1 serine/threonine protein kinase [Deinococcus proteolyticus MRP]